METKTSKFALLLIFATVFIDLIGFGIVIPLLPVFAEKFGAGGFMVGLLLMSYSLMQFFFTPFWGRLSDNVGRRPILLISLAASAGGYLLWGFAGSLWMLFASRIVAGFGNANIAVAQAYIADVTTAEHRAKGMGLIGAAFGLGFVLGPAIGGLCAAYGGFHVAGFVAAAFSLLDLVFTFFFLPEPPQRSQAAHERFVLEPSFYWKTLTSERLRVCLAIFFISTFAFANMEATLVLLTEHQYRFTPRDNGLMFAYIGLVMVFVQGGLIGRLARRFGEQKLVVLGSLLVLVGLLGTPSAASVPLLYLALGLLAVGSGINSPANQSILSRLAPADAQGGVLGVGQSLATLGRILGPIVGGASFQYLGMASPYYIGAAAMAVAGGLALLLPRLEAAPALAVSVETSDVLARESS
jgi:multidrug resistance protein